MTERFPRDTSALEPCPFCNSRCVTLYNGLTEWWVSCDDCQVTAAMSSNQKIAVDSWNRRTPAHTQLIDKLDPELARKLTTGATMAQLEDALKPFADAAAEAFSQRPDDWPISIKLGYCRKALAVLSDSQEGSGS